MPERRIDSEPSSKGEPSNKSERSNKSEPRSKSQRIADELREQIESGTLHPGDKIPSANELMVTYGCSITPVRRAVDQLKTLGLVVGHAGMGVYVVDRDEV
jgi:DNA-binding GntR family transcriptional regulator